MRISDGPITDAAAAPPGALRTGAAAPLAAEDFRRVAALLHAEGGVPGRRGGATPAHAGLARRLRALGLRSFRDYCALVVDAAGLDERQRRLAALTAEGAAFFRQPAHFEHLRRTVLPPLLEGARRGDRVRLWSAGGSDGPEAYSIGMVVLDLLPAAPELDVRILGSDLDADLVARARAGRYPASHLRPAPPESVRRWFRPLGPGSDALEAGPELKRLIAFRELDLAADWPMRGRFDAIFCRDVAVYLEEEAQADVWSRFASRLRPGGRLFTGVGERLSGRAASRFSAEGESIHRLEGAAP